MYGKYGLEYNSRGEWLRGEADAGGARVSERYPKSDTAPANPTDPSPDAQRGKKKPYQRPAFQHERVFETMALACGKLSPTQLQCHFNRKLS